jgi:hypothetical protein
MCWFISLFHCARYRVCKREGAEGCVCVCVCVWRDCVVKVEGNRSARGCIAPQWVDAVGGCIDYRRRGMSCMYMYMNCEGHPQSACGIVR